MSIASQAEWVRRAFIDRAQCTDQAQRFQAEILRFVHQDMCVSRDSALRHGQPGLMHGAVKCEQIPSLHAALKGQEYRPSLTPLTPADAGTS